MSVLSAIDDAAPLRRRPPVALPASQPVMLGPCPAIFQPALGAGHPVLMLSPFGYEELCSRAFATALADDFAAAGMPSLRFDFPGTGNALDADGSEGLEDWRRAAMAAATALRARTGHETIAVLGQGLGATLASLWAPDLGPLTAAVLLEPAVSGRSYLRGLKAWGRSIAASSGLPVADDQHSVAGFPLPAGRAAAIGALDLGKAAGGLPPAVLLLEQTGGAAGKLLDAALTPGGAEFMCRDFVEYADLLSDPTSARIPAEASDAIVSWLAARGTGRGRIAVVPRLDRQPMLRGEGFAERHLRFGRGDLAGVLCTPEPASPRRFAVVIVNAGRDPSIGWARSAVHQARGLAREGVASLRFDIGGIGDSRAATDAPDEILYSPRACDDLRAAIDHLHGLGYGSFGLLGRCSGAWAAFTVATGDARVRYLAMVNPGYFIWDDSKSLADVVRFSQRSVGDLGATMLRRDGLRRLLKGELDLRGAWRFVLRQGNKHVLRRLAPLLGGLTAESRRYHDLHALFTALKERDVGVLLAYAEGDSSLDELRSFMGPDLRRLGRYPAVSLAIIPGADHNFTRSEHGRALLGRLVAFFRAEDTGTVSRAPGVEPEACPADAYALVSKRA